MISVWSVLSNLKFQVFFSSKSFFHCGKTSSVNFIRLHCTKKTNQSFPLLSFMLWFASKDFAFYLSVKTMWSWIVGTFDYFIVGWLLVFELYEMMNCEDGECRPVTIRHKTCSKRCVVTRFRIINYEAFSYVCHISLCWRELIDWENIYFERNKKIKCNLIIYRQNRDATQISQQAIYTDAKIRDRRRRMYKCHILDSERWRI